MNILDRIIADKGREVALRQMAVPTDQLTRSKLFSRPTLSLADRLSASNSGIIAEFKRRSPSRSAINYEVDVAEVALGYTSADACGISILTDTKYFGGSLDDLLAARSAVKTPILRKDFIIDEYQLFEARAFGADVVLLIAAALSPKKMHQLAGSAANLGLEVLLEVHDQHELEASVFDGVKMIGVNNRDLKTFKTDIEMSRQLAELIPDDVTKISESGIDLPDTVRELREFGYRGFLIGESFMRTDNPGKAAASFIRDIK